MPFPHRLRSIAKRAVLWLSSLRLATLLLILITLAAIAGGVVPQSPITPNAQDLYSAYGPFWHRLITRLLLDDVFHSWWFFALIGLFALNLTLCTLRRARETWRQAFGPVQYRTMSQDAGIEIRPTDGLTLSDEQLTQRLMELGFRKVTRVTAPDREETQLVAHRFRWGALGADLVHVGILLILLGGLLGVLRQEGTFTVNEWEKGMRVPACSDGSSDYLPIDYVVQIDDFGVETYEESGRTKSFWADLSIWEGDAQLTRGRTEVNRPFSFAGTGFYPWRFGVDPTAARIRLHVFDVERNLIVSEVALGVSETVTDSETELQISALRYFQTFALDDFGEAVDLGPTPGGNPALLLEVSGTNALGAPFIYRDLALPFLPETASQPEFAFLIADSIVPAFMQIHVVRSPGYPVVWFGFVVVMVGMAAAFYFSPLTIRLARGPGLVRVHSESRRGRRQRHDIAERLRIDLERETTRED